MSHLGETGHLHVAGKAVEYGYCAGGRHGGPTIVLLHDGLGCSAMWKDFPQKLSAACGLAVFSYSRAGYGRSDSAGLPWPVSYMHDEARKTLPAVLAAAGIGRAVLVGHSDGASIAAIYAGSIHPNAACGLVLLAPHFIVEDVSLHSIAAARVAFDTGNLRQQLERYHGLNTAEAFCGWNGAWLDPEFRDWDITGYLPDIPVPILGLQGRDDEYGTTAQIDALRAGCTAPVETKLIDNCGHAAHRDQPDIMIGTIARFVARLPEIGI